MSSNWDRGGRNLVKSFQLARRKLAPLVRSSFVRGLATNQGKAGTSEHGSFSLVRRTAPRISSALLVTTSVAGLGLALATAPSFATDWTGATSTDWFDGTNWSAGVPTSGIDASIDTVTSHATIAGTARAQGLFVGNTGTGALTIQNGGTLSSSIGYIGFLSGSTGTVTVTGAGSSWTVPYDLEVGIWGTGTLAIQNGGKVRSNASWIGYSAGSTGTVTIDGAGSSMTSSSSFHVGDSGTGTLTIRNGGTVSSGFGYIGGNAGSTGAVTVTGTGSSWTNSLDIAVGNSSTGTLTIQNGGTVSNRSGYIGVNFGSTGTATVEGTGSSWTTSGDLYVGYLATGVLTIRNGGMVNVNGSVAIGLGAGSTGTLNIGAASGQTAAAPGTLNASAVAFGAGTSIIVFNHTASGYIFAPVISGLGSVTVEAGTTILTAANTYTSPTTINGGTLTVDGSITSGATVNAGGTLSGTGTIGNDVVINTGGTLAPGDPVGTLTISGNLTFGAGSFYRVALSPALANVSGAATLTGASVQAAVSPGSSIVKQSIILHAGGGLGGTTFSGISAPNFVASLSYTPTDVLLNLTAALGAGAGLNTNQQNIANTLNTFFNDVGTLPANFSGVFGLTGNKLGTTLSQLSGEAATGAQQGAFQFTGQFLNLMLDPLADGRGGLGNAGGSALGFAPERAALPDDIALAYAKATKTPFYKAPQVSEPRWSVWGSGFGGYNKTNGDASTGSNDLTARAAGAAAGLDYHLTRDAVIGFALAGGGTRWDLAQGLGGGKSDAFQGGLYAAVRSGPAYVAASLAAANHWMSTDRFAAFGDHLTASFNAQSFGGRIEGGYRIATTIAGITPYAAVQAQSFRTPSYSETDLSGGGFALTYASRSATDTRSELGARFDRAMLSAPDKVLTLRGRLAWAHDWVSDPSLTAVFQTLPGTSFLVGGATPAKDTALVSAGADLHLARGITLSAKFDGEFAGRSQTYAGTGTIRYNW